MQLCTMFPQYFTHAWFMTGGWSIYVVSVLYFWGMCMWCWLSRTCQIMGAVNNGFFGPSTIFLTGIPGLEAWHTWVSILFCFLYILAIIGNQCPHGGQGSAASTYCILFMLAISEVRRLCPCSQKYCVRCSLIQRRFVIDAHRTKMFFIHSSAVMDSVLLAMVFDQFGAIYNLLQYSAMLTHPWFITMGLVLMVGGVCIHGTIASASERLPFCKANILSHSYHLCSTF